MESPGGGWRRGLVRAPWCVYLVRLVVMGCWGTSGRGSAAVRQVVATSAVADVTVGANEVLGGAVDAKAREHLPVEVVQGAGSGLAGQ